LKQGIVLLMANSTTLVVAGFACYLAANGIKGWGWFLLVAALTSHTMRTQGGAK
jgi:hypothetical protein